MLKTCEDGSQCNEEAEDQFFQELTRQLAKIDKNFSAEATRLVAEFHRIDGGFCSLFNCFRSPRYYESLTQRAYWCRKYARVNAVALRKILKKHDKLCHNVRGREFLQQCWCSSSSQHVGLFLHSPLLDELKAIQVVLEKPGEEEKCYIKPADQSQVLPNIKPVRTGGGGGPAAAHDKHSDQSSTPMEMDPMSPTLSGSSSADCTFFFPANGQQVPGCGFHAAATVEDNPELSLPLSTAVGSRDLMAGMADNSQQMAGVQGSFSHGGDEDTLPSARIGEFEEEDLKCPICLDTLFRPVGLGCGHKFCQTCAFKFARKGKYSIVDSFKANLQRIPAETPCPECRQGHVYKNAVQLREVDALIRKKFPHFWRARRMEEEEKIIDYYAEKHAARPEFLRMMGTSPYDILNMY